MVDSLTPGCIFRIPFDFEDGAGPLKKYFILLGSLKGAAIAVKTTTVIARYGANPSGYPGIVFLPAPSYPFTKPTVIDPANGFAIDEPRIERHSEKSELELWDPIEGLLQNIYDVLPLHRSLDKRRKEGYQTVIRESLLRGG